MITIVILSLLTVTIVFVVIAARRRRRATRARTADIPLFMVPAASGIEVPRQAAAAPHRPYVTPATPHPSRRRDPTPAEPHRSAVAATIRTRDGAVATLTLPRRSEPDSTAVEEQVGEPVDARSVRYWRVADGTLQFLPGRLSIASGVDAGHEIRFVRTAGVDGTTVTFGRAEGQPYRHVQLREPTVSRQHARMVLENAGSTAASRGVAGRVGAGPRWRIDNLSATNPVIVNGRPLDGSGDTAASVMLADGDRIEMGEVAFVFHER